MKMNLLLMFHSVNECGGRKRARRDRCLEEYVQHRYYVDVIGKGMMRKKDSG
jgi:hypothetical protein